ncbi:tetratricopeptide repeat (TPR)-like superfamily protein [Actinidia rufa]|uniref:Tetratricopeptide repeat (TPR)-like superfamily protein n=1 Tax=Actinidia rufa TaxID=165716 RepID=A0A7J0E5J5_9ERIC|nr:tetratricopeptide repeat (TPR)-like superfamily protein [Actinidia rufa]
MNSFQQNLYGNLGWACMQQTNYAAAEVFVYRKAQYPEARSILYDVIQVRLLGSDDPKSKNRTQELMKELEPWEYAVLSSGPAGLSLKDIFLDGLDQLMNQWTTPFRSRRLTIFLEISPYRDQLSC